MNEVLYSVTVLRTRKKQWKAEGSGRKGPWSCDVDVLYCTCTTIHYSSLGTVANIKYLFMRSAKIRFFSGVKRAKFFIKQTSQKRTMYCTVPLIYSEFDQSSHKLITYIPPDKSKLQHCYHTIVRFLFRRRQNDCAEQRTSHWHPPSNCKRGQPCLPEKDEDVCVT
jgi:hypothetical protein